MPIYEYRCEDCEKEFESVEIWESHKATECKFCKSPNIKRIIATNTQVRMDADVMKHNLPDPSPPLEELRGKNKPGCTGGYEDKPYAEPDINKWDMTHDKYGNRVFKEKRRAYFDQKRGK
jgi:putative FmdB family regulatory protein